MKLYILLLTIISLSLQLHASELKSTHTKRQLSNISDLEESDEALAHYSEKKSRKAEPGDIKAHTDIYEIESDGESESLSTLKNSLLNSITDNKHLHDFSSVLADRKQTDNLVNELSHQGETLLMWAVENDEEYLCKQLVSKHKAELNVISRKGTALMRAVKRGNVELAQFFIDNGADVDAGDRCGNSPLLVATKMKSKPLCDLLIPLSQDINRQGSGGISALMNAAAHGDDTVTAAIVAREGNVNAVDKTGNTPLLHALKNNRQHVALFLLEKGASIFVSNKKKENPFTLAAKLRNHDLCKIFMKHAFHESQGNMKAFLTLIKKEISGGKHSFLKNTAYGCEETVHHLFYAQANVLLKPYYEALCKQSSENIRALLEAVDSDGKTAHSYFNVSELNPEKLLETRLALAAAHPQLPAPAPTLVQRKLFIKPDELDAPKLPIKRTRDGVAKPPVIQAAPKVVQQRLPFAPANANVQIEPTPGRKRKAPVATPNQPKVTDFYAI